MHYYNDVIYNLIQYLFSIGCKVFDKFDQLSTSILPISKRVQFNTRRASQLASGRSAGQDTIMGEKFTLRYYSEGKFLGVMTKSNKSISSARTKINHNLNIEDQIWYHGFIPLHRAEDRLLKDGDWLVRSSATFDTYGLLYLSILQKSLIYHIPIRFQSNGVFSLCQDQRPQLSQLIAHYSEKPIPILFNGVEIVLKNYVAIPPPGGEVYSHYIRATVSSEPINPEIELVSQPWFYGWVSSESVEPLLKQEGDFVVRQTPSDTSFWGNFVISSLCRSQTHHTHIKLSSTGSVYIYKSLEFPTICHLVAYHFNTQTPLPTTQSEIVSLLKHYPINQYQPDPLIEMYTKYDPHT